MFATWTTLIGGMPQGTWFGPYVFLILIDDLHIIIDTFKFVDDVTLTEVVDKQPADSRMQLAMNQLVEWSQLNKLNINIKKTKEMFMGPVLSNPPPQIVVNDDTVERVTLFKLLGVIANNLNWDEHVASIYAKANKRLHFLKLLKRSSVTVHDLLQYYKSVIRPIIEYACPVWQSGLTVEQRDRLESIQRRALKLISNSLDYELYCALYNTEPISVRLDNLARSFFRRICCDNDCLNYLLPCRRPTELLHKLRRPDILPGI
jgi:hypothetical protein